VVKDSGQGGGKGGGSTVVGRRACSKRSGAGILRGSAEVERLSILYRTKGWLTLAQLIPAWASELADGKTNASRIEHDLKHFIMEDIMNEALGARRSAIPRNEDRGWGQSAFRGIGPRPQALEQRRPYPSDFQGRLRGCGAAVLQPAQLSEDLSPSGRTHLQVSRRVQGLVPKPRPRERFDDVFELRGRRAAPADGDHTRARQGLAELGHLGWGQSAFRGIGA